MVFSLNWFINHAGSWGPPAPFMFYLHFNFFFWFCRWVVLDLLPRVGGTHPRSGKSGPKPRHNLCQRWLGARFLILQGFFSLDYLYKLNWYLLIMHKSIETTAFDPRDTCVELSDNLHPEPRYICVEILENLHLTFGPHVTIWCRDITSRR